MTSILITGAAGAIGTALCDRLAETTYDVVGVDVAEPRWEVGVSIEQADLTSSPDLPEADVVVHLAAYSRVPPVVDNPTKAFKNVTMTEPILEHARKTDAHVIFASSREVYSTAIQPNEGDADLDNKNPYGASKTACEALCNSYHHCYDLPITILRLSNVYGRYDTNPRVFPLFIALAVAGEELTVYGTEKVLDFVYMEDVIEAFFTAIERGRALAGETITIGSGRGTPLTKLADSIANKIDACPGYQVESNRSGEVERFVANTAKAEALLGDSPNTTLEEGLPPTIEWYLDHRKLLNEIRTTVGASD